LSKTDPPVLKKSTAIQFSVKKLVSTPQTTGCGLCCNSRLRRPKVLLHRLRTQSHSNLSFGNYHKHSILRKIVITCYFAKLIAFNCKWLKHWSILFTLKTDDTQRQDKDLLSYGC